MGLKKQVRKLQNGKEIAIYDSATEAAKSIGKSCDIVYKCCSGEIKQTNGYTFEYTGKYTNKVESNGEYKCPYCDKHFSSYEGLSKHIFRYKEHGDITTKEQLLTDVKYSGVRPTCKCGCGGYTNIRFEGEAHFQNYIRGHHNRVHNNWGHNPKAILHSADTRRKQYENGERRPWNKGMKWSEMFSKEKIDELMKAYTDEARNSKISKALKGVPKSEEHAIKCRENGRCEKSISINRKKMHDMLTKGKFSISSKTEEKFINECINPLNIQFIKQHYIKDIRHYCDVFIPSHNIIVEFQGDYWHANPQKYNPESLSKYQIARVKKDEILRDYCQRQNIKLIEIWESDFINNLDKVKKLLSENIQL